MGKSREIARLPNAPAFSAYANASTSLTTSAQTKVNFQVEDFNTNSNFASSRFTPTVHTTGSAVNSIAAQDTTRFDGCLMRAA